MNSTIKIAEEVLKNEANGIISLVKNLDENFIKSVTTIQRCKGRVVTTGIGKSGIIARKVSATLSSIGIPSYYIHPTETLHGDFGTITKKDVIILFSYSGETDELLRLLPLLRGNNNTIISICGNVNSTLALNSNYVLNVKVEKEACPFNLAPTTSTTAMLALGDALCIAVMKNNVFSQNVFLRNHPGGNIGKRLLVTVGEKMIKKNLPLVLPNSTFKEIINKITLRGLGLVIVISNQKKLLGIITDGDIRRSLEKYNEKSFFLTAKQIMTKKPKTISINKKLIDAEKKMNQFNINSLVVMDKNKISGILQFKKVI